MGYYNFVSFLGIFILIGFAWVFSKDRKNVNWRLVGLGVLFQILIALFIFVIPAGSKLFLFLNDAVIKVLDCAGAGSKFLFGRLALAPGTANEQGEASLGFILAFQSLPTIIFFSSFLSILYFYKIIPVVVRGFAYIFTKLAKVSGAESLVVASNVFVGIESMLTVKPFLGRMTRSEICTVLTAGMATVASNILALYVFSLKDQFPTIAGHLISASLLSAPAALVMSKILLPEAELPETLGLHVHPYYEKEKNIFEAIINGANAGLRMVAGIVAMLIAVLGLVALLNLILVAVGDKLNLVFGWQLDWSLKGLLGYIFYPFTLILGVPSCDAGIVSRIIAERSVLTEVVAYQDLAVVLGQGLLKDPRSAVITAYALCGFAHLASMAIFVGGFTALAPSKVTVVSQVAFRALIAATLACLMTACIAGMFFTNGPIVLGV
ncbi:MAG: nucleoside transporter C-terminal domain-containing protein [Candidatus Omnitrophota bacterium]